MAIWFSCQSKKNVQCNMNVSIQKKLKTVTFTDQTQKFTCMCNIHSEMVIW